MELTSEQLKSFDGNNPANRIFFSVQGDIFDVSEGTDFYGPGE